MKKNLFVILSLSILGGACADLPERPTPLAEKGPKVLYVVPGADEKLPTKPQVGIVFSRPIDPATADAGSILLTEGQLDTSQYKDLKELHQAIDKGTIQGVPSEISQRGDGEVVVLSPEEELKPGETYTLLVTPRVLSEDRIPLNQGSLDSPEPSPAFFTASYETVPAEPVQSPETSPSAPSIPPTPVGDSSPSEPSPPGDVPTPPSESPAPSVQERPVVLNEIFYDAVGNDTDGILFVELYGGPDISLNGFKINFVNGEDGKIYDSITIPQTARTRADGFYLVADSRTGLPTVSQVPAPDLIDNFDPQNGPDAVQLVDASGSLLDAVGYGDGIVPTAANGLATFKGTPAPDVINGHSLERRQPGFDTGNNAADFVDREVPTPGR